MFYRSCHNQKKSWLILASLIIVSLLSFLTSIIFGSVRLNLHELIHAIFFNTHDISHLIIVHFRLPRTGCAFVTGGLLALAGALMQSLLRNPLADPYVLGISGGASTATLLVMLMGITRWMSTAAFIGSLVSMLLVFSLARIKSAFSPLRLLLTGMVTAMGWSALISLLLTMAPSQSVRGLFFWLMGDLTYAHFSWWQPFILILGLFMSLLFARPLNLLIRNDLVARSLGVNTLQLNGLLYLLSSLLTACAVSIAGCVGFIGLVVPHMLRLAGTSDHRFILPASVLLGGSLLTFADTLSRSIIPPTQLPVGMVTAIIGVPCFLILLQRKNSL